MPVIFFLGAKSTLLIDCYFNETSWYQLRKDIFIRYDWADSHVESIWCKTWTHPVLRYPSKYFLWNRKITKELVIRRWKKEFKKATMTCVFLSLTILPGWDFWHMEIKWIEWDGRVLKWGNPGPRRDLEGPGGWSVSLGTHTITCEPWTISSCIWLLWIHTTPDVSGISPQSDRLPLIPNKCGWSNRETQCSDEEGF